MQTVMRPRLNPLLSQREVGIVDIAIGGVHGVALTHDGKAFSWVVNDDSALSRNTKGLDSDGENTQDVADRGDDVH